MDGAKETGLSTFIINEKIDCGAVLMQEKMVIGEQETAGELHDRMIPLGADLSVKTLDALATNGVEPQKQTLDGVSYPEAPKIFREDCEIDWNWPLERINNHVRGLSPYPAAFTHFKKNDKSFSLKIFRVEITREENNELTRPNLVYDDKGVFVIHPQGICRILELQVAGKKRMSAQEYVNDYSMNKSDLIDAMAADADISKAAAKKALDSFIGSVTTTLKKGGRVSLVGFGSFSVSKRSAREGINPQTKKKIKIPAKTVAKFKPGAELSKA
ncbi:unnamed protein product, partial [Cyprideis torosa]